MPVLSSFTGVLGERAERLHGNTERCYRDKAHSRLLRFEKRLPFVRADVTIFVAIGLQKVFGVAVRIMGFKFPPFDDTILVVIDLGERRAIAGEGSTGHQKDGCYGNQPEFRHRHPRKKMGVI